MTVVIAHRGASGEAPENTLAAFRLAVKQAVAVEFDVQRTRDGVLVICHDDNVDRTTDGTGELGAMTFKELRELSAGSKFGPAFAKERIPTLAEALDVLPDGYTLHLEIKHGPRPYEGIEAQILQALAVCRKRLNLYVSSFHHPSLLEVQRLARNIRTGVLCEGSVDGIWDYLRGIDLHAYGIHPDFDFCDAEFVREAHRRGYRVNVWNGSTDEQFLRLAKMGVDGVFADYPAHVRALYGQLR